MKLLRHESNRQPREKEPRSEGAEHPQRPVRFEAWLTAYRTQLKRLCEMRLAERNAGRPERG